LGLLGTIRRQDGLPFGDPNDVEQRLRAAYPEAKFGIEPSGKDKIAAAAARGIEFPEPIRRHFESMPARLSGVYEAGNFSIEFDLGAAPVIDGVTVELRGQTESAGEFLEMAAERYGWIVSYP